MLLLTPISNNNYAVLCYKVGQANAYWTQSVNKKKTYVAFVLRFYGVAVNADWAPFGINAQYFTELVRDIAIHNTYCKIMEHILQYRNIMQ